MGASGQPILLSCRSISKYFGAMAAVYNLSFDVRLGEVLGIGGPNGAGKTTLFDVISGLAPAERGRIYFAEYDIHRRSADRIRHLGIARTFQLNAVSDSLTVRENVLCGSYYGYRNVLFPGLRFDREARRRADEALELVRLADSSHVVARHLPVLKLKLLMAACALASKPKLLLLDEPVGGLNPREIDEMLALLSRLREERALTIVLIEHVMRFLVDVSDRVMIMHHGRKIYEGSAQGVARDKTVVEVYLGKGVSGHFQRPMDEQSFNG